MSINRGFAGTALRAVTPFAAKYTHTTGFAGTALRALPGLRRDSSNRRASQVPRFEQLLARQTEAKYTHSASRVPRFEQLLAPLRGQPDQHARLRRYRASSSYLPESTCVPAAVTASQVPRFEQLLAM